MIRKATTRDIKAIHRLLAEFGRKGDLLPRPLSQLYEHMRDFSVYTDGPEGTLAACCALQVCWEDLAEIRSLAVQQDFWGRRIGTRLVETMISEARQYGITKIFTLTYKPDFFGKFGFEKIDKSQLPLKIWGDCMLCVKFPDCDETAMMKAIEYPH